MANIWIIVAFGIWILLLSFPVANGLHDMNLTTLRKEGLKDLKCECIL